MPEPPKTVEGSLQQAELILWLAMQSLAVLLQLPLMTAVLMMVLYSPYSMLQAVLECCDESSYYWSPDPGKEQEMLLEQDSDSWKAEYCPGTSNCRGKDKVKCAQVRKVYGIELELISSLQNMVLWKIKKFTSSSVGDAVHVLIFASLVLHWTQFYVHGAANSGVGSVASACGSSSCSNRSLVGETPILNLMWPRIYGPGENSFPGSDIYPRDFKKQRKSTQALYPQVKTKTTTFKFMLHINGKEPGFQFVGDTVRNRFLILCYEFFSVTYANIIPMIASSAKTLRRYGRSVETIQVKLYGGPNHGYCAMLAIGILEQVQEVYYIVSSGSGGM